MMAEKMDALNLVGKGKFVIIHLLLASRTISAAYFKNELAAGAFTTCTFAQP